VLQPRRLTALPQPCGAAAAEGVIIIVVVAIGLARRRCDCRPRHLLLLHWAVVLAIAVAVSAATRALGHHPRCCINCNLPNQEVTRHGAMGSMSV
jgi:hypothetical protein